MASPDPVLFDTHRFVKRMTAAGMPLDQAETLAEEQATLLVSDRTWQWSTEELKGSVKTLGRDVGEVKEDVTVLKADVRGLKEDVTVLKEDVRGLKEDVAVLEAKVTMVQWVTGGVGFGMMLLLVQSFGLI